MEDSISKQLPWDIFNGFIPEDEIKEKIVHSLVTNTVDSLLASVFRFKIESGEPFDIDLPMVSIEPHVSTDELTVRMSTVFRFSNNSVCIKASAITVSLP